MFEERLSPHSSWRRKGAAYDTDERPLVGLPCGLSSWEKGWSVPVYPETPRAAPVQLWYNAAAWANVANGSWKRWGNTPAVEAEIYASSEREFPHRGNVYSTVDANEWKLPEKYRPQPGYPGTFRVAKPCRPAAALDGHMAVAISRGRVLETYATIRLSTGDIVALSYCVSRTIGELGNGLQCGQTASMVPCYLGLYEPDSQDHALAITVPAGVLDTRFVPPAYAFDRNALTGVPPYGGTLPMGARLATPSLLSGLETPEGRHIARLAHSHGFIIVDRGGEGVSLRVRGNARLSPPLAKWDWGLQQDLSRIFGTCVLSGMV